MRKNLGALSLLPFQDETLAIDTPGRILRHVRSLRSAGFHAVFDLEPFRRVSSIVTYLTRSPLRIGFDTNSRRSLYTNLVAYSNDKEFEAYNALRQLRVVGVPEDRRGAADLTFEIDAGTRDQARALLHEHGLTAGADDLVAVAAGVLKPHHRWVMSEFAALVRMILDHDPKTRVVFVGAPGDRADTEEVLRLLGSEARVTDLVGKGSFPVSLSVLAHCRMVVACDGGVVYMGAAMGCDTLSLWGPGVMERFAPPGERHIGYRKDFACIPCVRYDRLGEFPPCPYDRRCYNEMTAAEVFEQYRTLTASRA
jgi:ADP-heptose:LPS heptosyltransferase